jgi:Holliday junction resolvasome RuvABC endonuclease subunit
MLSMPEGSNTVTLVGIDPGTETLGVAVLTIDLNTMKIVSTIARTFTGSKLRKNSEWVTELFGARAGRIDAHEKNLLDFFRDYQPVVIASESPFINRRFPQAGLALTEVVAGIRRAVISYDPWKDLRMIDPPTVKRAVGGAGNALKDEVKRCVMKLTDLNYEGDVPLQFLDEHSIDAIAVGYCEYKTLLEKLCLIKSELVYL